MTLPLDAASFPSSSPEEDYYAVVEKHFVTLRGSPLFITPREWQLIHRWRQQQIPLRVVTQGLDRAFERERPQRPIRRLSYCRQTVESSYRRFREAIAGSQPGSIPSRPTQDVQDVRVFLERLNRELLESAKKLEPAHGALANEVRRVSSRLLVLLEQNSLDAAGLAELEQELDAFDKLLVEAAEAALGAEERERRLDEAERSLGDYRSRMPDDVFRSALRSAYLKRVRASFDLPALSLFYL